MGAKDGRQYLIYLTNSDPSDGGLQPDDSSNYDKVLLLQEHNFDEAVEAINTSTKDSGDDMETIGARADRDVSFTALWSSDGDPGQDTVQDSIKGGYRLWALITTDVSGDLEWYAEIVVTGRSITAADGSAASVDVTCKVNGSVTEQLTA